MKALAELLMDCGCAVSGSDSQTAASEHPASLSEATLFAGHAATNVPSDVRLLVYSPAVDAANVERAAAREGGTPEASYVDVLARLMECRAGVAIAGTHGKTTTTALVATLLREAGRNPSVIVGGEVVRYDRSGWAGDGPELVAEACEYRCHFHAFRPHVAAVLNIEPDHFDCFPTQELLLNAFARFVAQVDPTGRLIARAGSVADSLRESAACEMETYSVETAPDQADWTMNGLALESLASRFEIQHRGRSVATVRLPLPGRHNVENALAAVAVASAVTELAPEVISRALAGFGGTRRRFETVADVGGITVIDDYAHHPTAVRATLTAARQSFFGAGDPEPGHRDEAGSGGPHSGSPGRLVVAFQPHQVSRTRALLDEFAASFDQADETLLVPIFAAREASPAEAAAALYDLEKRMRDRGQSVRRLSSLEELLDMLKQQARAGDVWLMLGAGDISSASRRAGDVLRQR